MPLTNYTFSELITFTRTTTATVVGSNGLIQSAAINAPRFDYDPVTLAPRGILIEEQRTNLLLNSLIDGTSLATQNVTVAAVAHTFSFYGTGTVTLTGAHSAVIVGTGAYPARTTLTFTPSAGTLTVTVAGTAQFANLEAGAFATSYIPTVASQVTRTADQGTIVAPMFAPWYNQTEGTFVVEADSYMVSGNYTVTNLSDAGGAVQRVQLRTSAAAGQYIYIVGGGTQAFLTSGTLTNETPFKMSAAYRADDFAFSVNGGAVVTDTSGSIASPTELKLGRQTASAEYLNGHIRRVTYYPVRLTNAQLQALTA